MAEEPRVKITPAVLTAWKSQPGGLKPEQFRAIGKAVEDNLNSYLAQNAKDDERKRISDSPIVKAPTTE